MKQKGNSFLNKFNTDIYVNKANAQYFNALQKGCIKGTDIFT